MTNSGLKKAELFNIEGNRPATVKQLYAVGRHFAKIHDAKNVYRFSKVFGAILLKFQAEHQDTPITFSDVNNFLQLENIPPKIAKCVTTKPQPKQQPKVEKKVAVKKTATKPQPKVAKKTEKKASEMSVSEFQAKLESLNTRLTKTEMSVELIEDKIEAHAKELSTVQAKLDILMAWLETNPDNF